MIEREKTRQRLEALRFKMSTFDSLRDTFSPLIPAPSPITSAKVLDPTSDDELFEILLDSSDSS